MLAMSVLLTTLCTTATCGAAQQNIILVEPPLNGANAQAVVEQAFTAAAKSLRQKRGETIVEFKPGLYRLERPIILDDKLSGTPDRPLIIRGLGEATISGSRPLVERPRRDADTSILNRIPESARDAVRLYELPPHARNAPNALIARAAYFKTDTVPFEVFDQAGALTPAQWPNEGSATTRDEKSDKFHVSPEKAKLWTAEADMWVAGNFWSFEVLRVTFVNKGNAQLKLFPPSPQGIAPGSPYHVLHVAAELDAPGEWYRAQEQGTLFAIPRDDGPLEISTAVNLFVINGARNVELANLTLERSRGHAVSVNDSENVRLRHLNIRWTGGRAAIVQRGSGNSIKQCTVSDTGDGGFELTGGNRRTLTPARHSLSSSIIQRYQRLTRSYRGAADLQGVGMEVVGNLITDAQHYAIRFQGNNHIIASNEITRVVTETGDMGAIYTGRDWTTLGNKIRHNFIHQIGNPISRNETKGIYLDDGASGTQILGNIFFNTMQPVFLGGGHDNDVVGNVFIRSSPGIYLDGRGLTWARSAITDRKSEIWQRLFAMPFRSQPWLQQYPQLPQLLEVDAGVPRRNTIRDNVTIAGRGLEILSEVPINEQTISGNVSIADEDPRLQGQLQSFEPSDLLRPDLKNLITPAAPYLPGDLSNLVREKAGRYAN